MSNKVLVLSLKILNGKTPTKSIANCCRYSFCFIKIEPNAVKTILSIANWSQSFFKWVIPDIFFLYFRLQVTENKLFDKSLPVTGFELRICLIGGDRSTNWATTTGANLKTRFWKCTETTLLTYVAQGMIGWNSS